MRYVLTALFALSLLALPGTAKADTNIFAEGHKFGIGVGGGSGVYGVSGKIFLGDKLALQAAAGEWGFPGVGVNADLLVQMPQFFANDVLAFNWYLGGGPGLVFSGWGALTVAAVGGVSCQLKMVPVEITAEVRPTVLIGSELHGLDLFDGGGSVRWWF